MKRQSNRWEWGGEANPKGGDAVSLLELTLKLLDGMLKLVGIITGLNALVNASRKRSQPNKKSHRE
ncbi:hypothetical protein NST44_02465 [Paenibacillus sp. FSL W8-0919]|uniref:hypothetical protein n=1 Tax=Paenibacillus sp. FSL W8-0919 TaxID=2954707 RepID=UPI0030F6DC37